LKRFPSVSEFHDRIATEFRAIGFYIPERKTKSIHRGHIKTRNELMETTTFLFESIRMIFCFLLLLFVPGLALSLVMFPRLPELSTIDRLIYSLVLSISSSIASVVFIDIVPGLDLTFDTLILVISVFSLALFLLWTAERYYLTSRLKKQEPEIPKNNRDLEKYHTRGINATKDRFRADTRTVVVYHENWKSGPNHTGHSYLMDAGEEIDIQQVADNKLNKGDSYIVNPPYPETRYFEVIIREYNDNALSQVDDLQIFPVFVTKNPIKSPGSHALPPGALQITKRIYQKTSTTEIEWIYSHDFHIFAILHAEDTLSQMVDLILGKLDEIVTSLNGGVRRSISKKDRHSETDASNTFLDIPRRTPHQTEKFSRLPEFPPGVHSKSIRERTVIPTGSHPGDIPEKPEFQLRVPPADIQKRQILQTVDEPKPIILHPGVYPRDQVKDILKHPENKLVVDSIRKLQKDILRDLDMFNLTTESFKRSRKNIENIQIPNKADVYRKLAEAKEEMRDLDWLYE
jgi:hypothetical protein